MTEDRLFHTAMKSGTLADYDRWQEAVAIQKRLDYLRGEIEAERISYEEIAELSDLAEHIDPADVALLQWAGVPEHPEESDDEEAAL